MSFFTRNVIRWHVTRYMRLLDGVDVYLVIMNENTLFLRTLFRSNYGGLRGIDSKNRSEDRFYIEARAKLFLDRNRLDYLLYLG